MAELTAPPPPDLAQEQAVKSWQQALQRLGVGTNLTATGVYSQDWINAVNAYGEKDKQPTDRSEGLDAQLAATVVDQNPSCFSPEVRAQFKVGSGQ